MEAYTGVRLPSVRSRRNAPMCDTGDAGSSEAASMRSAVLASRSSSQPIYCGTPPVAAYKARVSSPVASGLERVSSSRISRRVNGPIFRWESTVFGWPKRNFLEEEIKQRNRAVFRLRSRASVSSFASASGADVSSRSTLEITRIRCSSSAFRNRSSKLSARVLAPMSKRWTSSFSVCIPASIHTIFRPFNASCTRLFLPIPSGPVIRATRVCCSSESHRRRAIS